MRKIENIRTMELAASLTPAGKVMKRRLFGKGIRNGIGLCKRYLEGCGPGLLQFRARWDFVGVFLFSWNLSLAAIQRLYGLLACLS
jgi:hypothetical protein